jgi:hypothetical protein
MPLPPSLAPRISLPIQSSTFTSSLRLLNSYHSRLKNEWVFLHIDPSSLELKPEVLSDNFGTLFQLPSDQVPTDISEYLQHYALSGAVNGSYTPLLSIHHDINKVWDQTGILNKQQKNLLLAKLNRELTSSFYLEARQWIKSRPTIGVQNQSQPRPPQWPSYFLKKIIRWAASSFVFVNLLKQSPLTHNEKQFVEQYPTKIWTFITDLFPPDEARKIYKSITSGVAYKKEEDTLARIIMETSKNIISIENCKTKRCTKNQLSKTNSFLNKKVLEFPQGKLPITRHNFDTLVKKQLKKIRRTHL